MAETQFSQHYLGSHIFHYCKPTTTLVQNLEQASLSWLQLTFRNENTIVCGFGAGVSRDPFSIRNKMRTTFVSVSGCAVLEPMQSAVDAVNWKLSTHMLNLLTAIVSHHSYTTTQEYGRLSVPRVLHVLTFRIPANIFLH